MHVVGLVIVDIIRTEVLVLLVELENIVAHDQVAVVQQRYDIMQIHHVSRQHVQINQQTHIIHLMHHLMHVVGLVIVDIIRTEVLVLLVELENIVAHDQLVVVQQVYDIMQIHHVSRQHVQINQQTHIIHPMHHLMHVVGNVIVDILNHEIPVFTMILVQIIH